MYRRDVRDTIDRLQRDEIISLGSHGQHPVAMRRYVATIPHGRSIDEVEAIVRAAFRSKRVAIAIVTGGVVTAANQGRLLTAVARELPGSRVVCLNLGELRDAGAAAYARLEQALGDSYVGNLYIDDPVTPQEHARKTRLKAIVKENKRKDGYRQQLARDDAWALLQRGCNAWFNPTAQGRAAAVAWRDAQAPAHCRQRCSSANPVRPGTGVRCRGISSRGVKCCLCTRHESRYCHHHRFADPA